MGSLEVSELMFPAQKILEASGRKAIVPVDEFG